jgi:hypothetical protein
MTKLFVEGKVCVYKTNPVNEKATEPVGKAVFSEMIKVLECAVNDEILNVVFVLLVVVTHFMLFH